MAKIERFEDLEVWQIAKEIAVEVYRISDLEPIKSDFGLKDQIRRAALCHYQIMLPKDLI